MVIVFFFFAFMIFPVYVFLHACSRLYVVHGPGCNFLLLKIFVLLLLIINRSLDFFAKKN